MLYIRNGGEGMGREEPRAHRRRLRTEDGSARDRSVVDGTPTGGIGSDSPGIGRPSWAAATRSRRAASGARPSGAVDRQDVVDRSGGVLLGHEEGVRVPELGLHERAGGLGEPEADEDLLELPQPGEVRVGASAGPSRNGGADIVGAKRSTLPSPLGEELRCYGTHRPGLRRISEGFAPPPTDPNGGGSSAPPRRGPGEPGSRGPSDPAMARRIGSIRGLPVRGRPPARPPGPLRRAASPALRARGGEGRRSPLTVPRPRVQAPTGPVGTSADPIRAAFRGPFAPEVQMRRRTGPVK